MKTFSYIICGCGPFSCNTFPGAVKETRLKPAGLVDFSMERIEKFKQTVPFFKDVPAYGSLSEGLAAAKPDLVFVHTPLGAHFINCKEALEAGCNVSVAKPFVETTAEARKLIELSKRQGKFVSVGQTARFGKTAHIKRMMDDPKVGRPVYANVHIYRDRAQNLSEYQVNESWPVINATLIHLVDQTRFWTGKNFTRVSFRGIDTPWNPYHDPGVTTGWLEASNGFVLSIFQSYVSRVCLDNRVHPYENYHIQCENAALNFTGPWGMGPLQLLDPGKPEPETVAGVSDNYEEIVAEYCGLLYDSLASKDAPVFCPANDNIYSLAAMKAMELSARRGGQTVNISEVL